MYRPYLIDKKTGEKKRTTRRGFRTKSEAEMDYISSYINERARKKEIKYLFPLVAKEWFELYKFSGIKPSTIYSRERTYLAKLREEYQETSIDEIHISDYERFLFSLKEQGYVRNYVLTMHGVMNMIMRYAMKKEYIEKNFLSLATLPRWVKTVSEAKEKIENLYLTKEELKKFLKTAEAEADKVSCALLYVLAYTGCRIGEATALEFSDIDYEKKEIMIYKTLYRVGNGVLNYEITTPKSEASIRKVLVSDVVIEKLKELEVYVKEQKENYVGKVKEDFCFIYLNEFGCGCPLTISKVNEVIRSVTKSSGIKKGITSHKLRHTHVSLLAEAGESLSVIKERVGHESSKITEKIYLHVTPNRKGRVVTTLDKILS